MIKEELQRETGRPTDDQILCLLNDKGDEGELLEERLDLALDLRERLDFHSCSACVLLRSEDA